MKARPWIPLAALIVGACSDDFIAPPEPAEFAELCGESEPVRILALDPDRPLAAVLDRGMFGERRVLEVRYLGDEEDALSSAFPPTGDRELWSVGPCGEDPLLIAEGARNLVRYPDVWPDLLLECDPETGRISTLDPTGTHPANPVFETDGCFTWETDDGILTIAPHDEETGALMLQPWPDDPWTMTAEPIVILDSVRKQATPPHTGPAEYEVLGVTDDDYLAITTNDELVAVSRVDGETTTVATDVREFEYDSTGRYVVWQSVQVTNDDPVWPEGPIHLSDRQTGEDTLLFEGALAHTPPWAFTLESLGLLHLRVEAESTDRFYRLPTLESFDVPGGIRVMRAADDTRVLIADEWNQGPYWLFDTITYELTKLYEGSGQAGVWEDEMFVLEGVQCCNDANSTREAGRLVRVSFEGEIDVLARRATFGWDFLSDGRVLTAIDIGTDWVGSLIVVDPETLEERLIADRVLRLWPSGDSEIEGDPILVYTIVDPDDQGVWIARLGD
jgi:hypothetical protein